MKTSLQQIGLPTLGSGATWFYRKQLEQLYQATHGSTTACPLVEIEVDFARINALLPDKFTQLNPLLDKLFLDLDAAEVSLIVIPNITLHVAIDRLELPAALAQKLVHPIKLGIAALEDTGTQSITLAGTRHTMQSSLLRGYFERAGIRVMSPGQADMERLDQMRVAVFESGVTKALEQELAGICQRYPDLVIACTELSMLYHNNAATDLARLQIERTIELV